MLAWYGTGQQVRNYHNNDERRNDNYNAGITINCTLFYNFTNEFLIFFLQFTGYRAVSGEFPNEENNRDFEQVSSNDSFYNTARDRGDENSFFFFLE